MSDFAGNLTGPVLDEQIFIGGQWLTFRTRGGPKTPDALISPSTKTPYTDEFMLGWATSLGKDYTLSASVHQARDPRHPGRLRPGAVLGSNPDGCYRT